MSLDHSQPPAGRFITSKTRRVAKQVLALLNQVPCFITSKTRRVAKQHHSRIALMGSFITSKTRRVAKRREKYWLLRTVLSHQKLAE